MSKNVENHKEVLKKVDDFMKEKNSEIKDSQWRENYHFMMPAGWINDPCGLVEADGTYHLFCQHHPYEGRWGQMFWGHAISKDMINWEMCGEAIAPSEDYDGWTGGGIFTGSAIYEDGEIKVFYTGCNQERQVQCLATSKDGINFIKHESNPIISAAPEGTNPHDFRDPKVWKHEDYYYMVTGGTEGVSALLDESTYKTNGYGKVFLHRSKDLINWEFVNDLVESRGELGTMLECPNFFQLGNKYVLIYSPMGMPQRKCVYLTGEFSYKTGKFNWNVMGEADWGFDYYAPQIFNDHTGRTLSFGWIGSWPFMPWNNQKYDTSKNGWCGSISLPRVLTMCDDGKIKFEPAVETNLLRTDCKQEYSNVSLNADEAFSFTAGDDNIHCEIEALIEIPNNDVSEIIFELRKTDTNSTKLIFDLKNGELVFDRTKSGNIEALVRKCNLESADSGKIHVRMFLDTSSMEIFTDDYRTVMTNNVYSTCSNDVGLSITSIGGSCIIKEMSTYGMKKVINW